MSESRLRNTLEAIGGCLLYLAFLAVFGVLIVLFFWGSAYLASVILPVSGWITLIALGLVPILLILSIPRVTRGWGGLGLVLCSYAIGLCVWLWSLVIAYQLAGMLWLVVGLFLAGVGVVLVAAIAALLQAQWSILIQIVIGVIVVYVLRIVGHWIIEKSEPAYDYEPAPPPPPDFSDETMSDEWRRLKQLIEQAAPLMYSEKVDFAELVTDVALQSPHATLDEIHVAIESVTKIEEELQSVVFSKYRMTDNDVLQNVLSEGIQAVNEIKNAETDEIEEALRDICALKAEKAFHTLLMAFQLSALEPEESFAGAVHKAVKIKNGPITLAERRRFKQLTDQLADSGARIRQYNYALAEADQLTPEVAEDIVTAFYDVLVAQEEVKLMDAEDLPYPREIILKASNVLIDYLTNLRDANPRLFQDGNCEALLDASQTLFSSLSLFYDIDAEDKETVSELNLNWRQVEDRIKNNEASESDHVWMEQARQLILKYQFR
ncbi:MAG: hypothetical protein ACXWID_05490 [Pyrinomonadaceae bacterium]